MKKTLIGPLLTIIAIVLLAAMFIYFYISLNRLDSKLMTIQTTTVTDSSKITAIVNFLILKLTLKPMPRPLNSNLSTSAGIISSRRSLNNYNNNKTMKREFVFPLIVGLILGALVMIFGI